MAQRGDPYESGEWVQEMVDKWGVKETKRFLNAFLGEYNQRLSAHENALGLLTDESTIADMKALVNKEMPGVYASGSRTQNFVNPSSGKMNIASYVPSNDMMKDMNSFFNHHMGAVHEPIHMRDIANAKAAGTNYMTGRFAAQTEVNAYSRNIEVLKNGLNFVP